MRYQPRAELHVRDLEPVLVARLKERADEHRRSVEDEHRAILREVLVGGEETPTMTFEAYLRKMPDGGTDADFSRIEPNFLATRNVDDMRAVGLHIVNPFEFGAANEAM